MNTKIWPVGVLGALIVLGYVALTIYRTGGDPTVMLAQGTAAEVQLSYAETVLGRKVATRPELGHDGRFFFILANDPLLLAPERHAAFLDLPSYRAQRILYPLLGGGFGLLPPPAVVWGLIMTTVAAAGIGSLAAAGVAKLMGANRWLGLAFVVNPGTVAEVDIGGAGVLALAAGVVGLWLLANRVDTWPVVALAAAGLARETMILFAAGLFVWSWRVKGSLRPALIAVPVAAAVVWRLYAGFRLASVEPASITAEGLLRNFDLVPLRGALNASSVWQGNQTKAVWMLALLALLLLFVVRAWKSRAAIAWSAWPFALLAVFLSELVWLEPYDFARAVAPVYLAYPLLLFARRRRADVLHPLLEAPHR